MKFNLLLYHRNNKSICDFNETKKKKKDKSKPTTSSHRCYGPKTKWFIQRTSIASRHIRYLWRSPLVKFHYKSKLFASGYRHHNTLAVLTHHSAPVVDALNKRHLFVSSKKSQVRFKLRPLAMFDLCTVVISFCIEMGFFQNFYFAKSWFFSYFFFKFFSGFCE